VTKDPRFDRIAAAQKAGLKAAMAVPALAGEEVVAVLSFFLFEPREEDERLVRVVQTIGTQLGWIIQRRRAEQERRNLLERERAARAEAEAALQRLRAIQSVTDAALAHLALDDLLGEMLARLSAVLAADSAAVLLLSEDGTSLFVRAVRGLDEAKLKGFRIPMGSGIAGSIAARREPLMIEDVSRFPIVSAYFRERVRSLIGVPLLVENQVVGVLQVGTHQLRRFSQEDLRLLQLVADRVAPTIDRARLYEQGRESRERLQALSRRLVDLQEAERREIAGELHDEVGQLLTGLRLLLESRPSPATTSGRKPGLRDLRKERASRRRGPAKRHPARRSRKQEMQDLLNDLMGRIRDMSMNLRPPMLDSLGLLPALLWHFGRYTSQTGVRVEVRHTRMDRRFAREVEMAAFRIVQEALTNVARHAGVDEVAVEVSADRQRLRIQVQDRGRGFAPASALAGPSSGLTGMRERAQLLGGVLNIASAPGAGTRLLAELPLRPSGAKRRRKA
jgi:signal transduction histidine kinase